MQTSGDGEAAAYFYSTFLKCQLAHNASRQTKQFYEVVSEFIGHMDVPQAEKVELRGDLIAYLRGNRATLEPTYFRSGSAAASTTRRFCQEMSRLRNHSGNFKEP